MPAYRWIVARRNAASDIRSAAGAISIKPNDMKTTTTWYFTPDR